MHKRKLLIGLATAGLLLAGFGAATMPASAEQRTLLVTLLGGAQVTVTVDVAPGTPTDQIQIPGVSAPIVSVQDVTPARPRPRRSPPPTPAQPPVAVQVDPNGGQSEPAPTDSSSSSSAGKPAGSPNTPTQEPQAGLQSAQQTTGKAAKAQAPVDAVKKAKDDAAKKAKDAADKALQDAGLRQPDGQPTLGNPTLSEALPGPAPIGVPNFFIDKFRIPPFLLPIYQAAGIEYGVRWEILAAINEIETDYGRNLNVSTAGAVGWMQFMPSTWKRYGVDANHDGRKDPFNPVDAIFAAARYLKAAARRPGRPRRRLRLQPRRLVRRLGPHARASDRRAARRPRRVAHRPHPGALPRARQGPLRRRHRRQRGRRPSGSRRARTPRSPSPRRARARGSTCSPRPARR